MAEKTVYELKRWWTRRPAKGKQPAWTPWHLITPNSSALFCGQKAKGKRDGMERTTSILDGIDMMIERAQICATCVREARKVLPEIEQTADAVAGRMRREADEVLRPQVQEAPRWRPHSATGLLAQSEAPVRIEVLFPNGDRHVFEIPMERLVYEVQWDELGTLIVASSRAPDA